MRNFLGMGSGKAEPAAQPARKDSQWRAPKDTPVRASASTAARASAEAAERRKQSSSQPLTVRPSLAAIPGFGHNACRFFSWLLLRNKDSHHPPRQDSCKLTSLGVHAQALTGTQPSAAASQQRPERCLQCGDSFRTLQELLFHVEAYHPGNMRSNVPSAGWPSLSALQSQHQSRSSSGRVF